MYYVAPKVNYITMRNIKTVALLMFNKILDPPLPPWKCTWDMDQDLNLFISGTMPVNSEIR